MLDARDRILAAAEDVIREYGLVNTTTKLIAKAAGCSEALLYKHFADKSEIVLAVMAARSGGFPLQTATLRTQVGEGDLDERLVQLVAGAIGFYRQGMPIGTALLSDPALLARHRSLLAERGAGPHKPLQALADYLSAEQTLGRIDPGADPDTIAALLLGSAFQRAFFDALLGDSPDTSPEDPAATTSTVASPTGPNVADQEFARRAVRAVLRNGGSSH